MTRCYLGLGGNTGNPKETFALAIKTLDSLPGLDLVATSRVYRSEPMGRSAGDEFRNQVVCFETNLEPHEILTNLKKVEDQFGRKRTEVWGPRSLDIDLLYLDQVVIKDESLSVPHPQAWYRRFVLQPLCELAPDLVHPVYDVSQKEFLNRIDKRPLVIHLSGGDVLQDNLRDLEQEYSGLRFESPLLPDPEEALVVCGSRSPGIGDETAAVDLTSLPGRDLESLRSVIQAVLGSCMPD